MVSAVSLWLFSVRLAEGIWWWGGWRPLVVGLWLFAVGFYGILQALGAGLSPIAQALEHSA